YVLNPPEELDKVIGLKQEIFDRTSVVLFGFKKNKKTQQLELNWGLVSWDNLKFPHDYNVKVMEKLKTMLGSGPDVTNICLNDREANLQLPRNDAAFVNGWFDKYGEIRFIAEVDETHMCEYKGPTKYATWIDVQFQSSTFGDTGLISTY
ncbi:MAG: hypothetical protein ABEJ65_05790, partial [bacterium]